jgi:hypothetical protein
LGVGSGPFDLIQVNARAPTNAPAGAAPAEQLALREKKTLTVRLEIVRRTKPALAALDAVLSADQKKTLAALAVPRMGMR